MINQFEIKSLKKSYNEGKPFKNLVIDKFLNNELAKQISNEFPEFDSKIWRNYDNPIEVKRLTNHYDNFGPESYKLFNYLNSNEFIDKLSFITGIDLIPDYGLNGGGYHIHKSGGKLNAHLDYSVHPKLNLERRINLIIYVTPNWNEKFGGSLGFWSGDENAPKKLIKSISPNFNRAVIFDTSENSWHGLPEPLNLPKGVYRKSLAIYYLSKKRNNISKRGKALFHPYKDQIKDPKILELIKNRSDSKLFSSVYETNSKK